MSKLNLDFNQISACRVHATNIATQVQGFIDQHSTVSVERSILRLLGVDGINDFGIPLVNVVIDHLSESADLSLGVCHYISYAIHDLKLNPQEISILISKNKLDLSI